MNLNGHKRTGFVFVTVLTVLTFAAQGWQESSSQGSTRVSRI